MPRKNRTPRTRKRKKGVWTFGHRHQLETGHGWFGGFSGGCLSSGPDHGLKPGTLAWIEASAAWQILAPQILRDWIDPSHPRRDCSRLMCGPGTRPWAWWHLDKRERRRRLNGVHPFDNPERNALVAARTAEHGNAADYMKVYFGCPGALCIHDDFEAVYESEPQYLERLKLWLPGERELFIKLYGEEALRGEQEASGQ